MNIERFPEKFFGKNDPSSFRQSIQQPFEDCFVVNQVMDYVKRYHELPSLNRDLPPLFIYLEILRLMYSENRLEMDIVAKLTPEQWKNSLEATEVCYWIQILFPFGLQFLQKKTQVLHKLIHYHPNEHLDILLFKRFTKESQNADERSTAIVN
ncbi:MAG: hypothetical protein EOP45_04125 [Sphingobacteriaceae bacterium]|nr:MAG: hypothetical protein EOP45_04125 [Sphingobacteriaceae bacterium]